MKKRDYTPIEGNIVYVLSFIIPLVILVAIYFAREIYPFGDNCYLRSDMYHQYLPFYSELWYKLRNHGSLLYAFDMGLGVNFTATYAYYLSCPLNWLLFIFPHQYLIEVMNGLIIIKLSLSSLTCTYYLSNRFHTKNIHLCVFGTFYGLSGYLAAYSWNIMWLDCVLLLPLIILGLERLVREKKYYLYTITLGMAILSNYYIAIMICLTMILYFIFLMVRYSEKNIKGYLIQFKNFAAYSLLAGGLSACLLLPELFALSYTVSSDISFPKSLTEYFSILQMLSRHMVNVETHMGLDHHPNIYCGVAIFLLLPLYVMNKHITTKEKAGKLVLVGIFLLAFNLNIPNFIWHGLHFPNSLPCRQSFIYVFFLITMCYDAFRDVKFYSRKELTIALWIALGFMLFADQVLVNDSTLKFTSVYLSAGFILLYVLIIYLYRSKKLPYMVLLFIFFASTVIECALNYEATALGTTSRSYYLSDNADIDYLLDTAARLDDSFYRVEKYSGVRTKNDAAWHGYHSTSLFSSIANGGLSKLYGHLGMEQSTNAYSYNGGTFLSAALFNVRYILSDTQMTENDLLSYLETSNGYYLYENNYTLPLGFMLPSTFEENWDQKNTNPFKVQNSFLKEATGIQDVFVELNTERVTDSSVKVNNPRTQQVYLKVQTSGLDTVNVYIDDNSKSYNIKHNHIIDLGVVNSSDEIRITTNDLDNGSLSIIAYTINETAFINAINQLSKNGMEVTTLKDTLIEGTIHADYDGKLLMSIPYDLGWTIYIDGERMKQSSLEKALTMLDVTAGDHTILMKYCPEGFKIGSAITGICVIILVMLYLSKKFSFFNKELTFNKEEEIL